MRDSGLLILIVSLILVTQSTIIGFLVPQHYRPDLLLIVVIWSSMRISFRSAAVSAFFLGFLVDLLSGSPQGFFSTIYCLVLVLCGYTNSLIETDTYSGRFLMALVSVFFAGVAVVGARWSMGEEFISLHLLNLLLIKALITGVFALLIFPLLDTVRSAYQRLIGYGDSGYNLPG